MTIEIVRFPVGKAELLAAPSDERAFFIALGYICDELTILQKHLIAVWQYRNDDELDIQSRARVVQANFFIKMLCSKLHEAWNETFRTMFFARRFNQEYQNEFSEGGLESLNNLRRYFGRRNLVHSVRNDFGFHNPDEAMLQDIENTPENEDWAIYISQQQGNSLYYISEAVAAHIMLSNIEDDRQMAYDRLFDETMNLVSDVMKVANDCMRVFVNMNFGDRVIEKEVIRFRSLSIRDIGMVFFTETDV